MALCRARHTRSRPDLIVFRQFRKHSPRIHFFPRLEALGQGRRETVQTIRKPRGRTRCGSIETVSQTTRSLSFVCGNLTGAPPPPPTQPRTRRRAPPRICSWSGLHGVQGASNHCVYGPAEGRGCRGMQCAPSVGGSELELRSPARGPGPEVATSPRGRTGTGLMTPSRHHVAAMSEIWKQLPSRE